MKNNRLLSTVFVLNAVIFFFQAMTKNVYPPLVIPFMEAFSIDKAQAGLLITLVFMGYALARFPSGILADRIGCTPTVYLGSLAMALSFFTVGLFPGYLSTALFTFVLGVSSGIYVTAGYTLAVILGTRSRAATATAVFESFGMVAGIISPILVTLFIIHSSWQAIFFTQGMVLLAVTALFYGKRRYSSKLEGILENNTQYPYPEKTTHRIDQEGKLLEHAKKPLQLNLLWKETKASMVIFKDPQIRRFIIWSTLVGGLGAISWTGINSFIPTYLVEEKSYNYETANRMFALVAISALATKIGVGWLADRFGTLRVLLSNLLLGIFLFFAFTLVVEHLLLLLILILLGATCLNTNTLINSYVLRLMPEKYQGTGFGLFCTAYTIIYSCGPYITGILSVSLGLTQAIRISSAGAVVAALLIIFFTNKKAAPNQAASLYSELSR